MILSVRKLSVSVADKAVLNEIDLEIAQTEVVALMGANGSGKTSFAQVLMGNPNYQITGDSTIQFDRKDLSSLSVDERARAGLFVAWQNPVSISGVSILSFLRVMHEANGGKIETLVGFRNKVKELLHRVGLSDDVLNRSLNEGFSGGEKKRFELLQLLLLKPKLAILDEIDSGVDIDGLRLISEIVNEMRNPFAGEGTTFILITHYKRLLDYILVDKVVIFANGKVAAKGGSELVEKIEKVGYAKFD